MQRRQAVAWMASVFAAGCGGGGGGSAEVTAAAPAPASGPAPGATSTVAAPATAPGTPHIAMWGDSLTVPVALELSHVITDRQIFNGGAGGETSMQIAARQAANNAHRDWINIFWYGHNNVLHHPATAAEEIKRDLAASISRLAPGNSRFLVLSVVNNAESPRGSERYRIVTQLNSELAALYPRNYLDIRSFMVAQYDPNNAQHRAEFEQDLPSSSLRFDLIHLTYYGSDLLAKWLKQQLAARGW